MGTMTNFRAEDMPGKGKPAEAETSSNEDTEATKEAPKKTSKKTSRKSDN